MLYYSYCANGVFEDIYQMVETKMGIDKEQLKYFKKHLDCNYITYLSPFYPDELKNMDKPPYVLYYRGNLDLLNEPNKIAVIGSRKYSEYGKKMTEKIVSKLVNHSLIIVSGLAEGIDGIAHRCCLEHQGKTIAIIGSGINKIYPTSNKNLWHEIETLGLVLSEYPPNVSPSPQFFKTRNRIIAALSKGIVVCEASLSSGTMNTVKHGLNYGKEIYAVPYEAMKQSGCNEIIRQGALLVEKGEDILQDLFGE